MCSNSTEPLSSMLFFHYVNGKTNHKLPTRPSSQDEKNGLRNLGGGGGGGGERGGGGGRERRGREREEEEEGEKLMGDMLSSPCNDILTTSEHLLLH